MFDKFPPIKRDLFGGLKTKQSAAARSIGLRMVVRIAPEIDLGEGRTLVQAFA